MHGAGMPSHASLTHPGVPSANHIPQLNLMQAAQLHSLAPQQHMMQGYNFGVSQGMHPQLGQQHSFGASPPLLSLRPTGGAALPQLVTHPSIGLARPQGGLPLPLTMHQNGPGQLPPGQHGQGS